MSLSLMLHIQQTHVGAINAQTITEINQHIEHVITYPVFSLLATVFFCGGYFGLYHGFVQIIVTLYYQEWHQFLSPKVKLFTYEQLSWTFGTSSKNFNNTLDCTSSPYSIPSAGLNYQHNSLTHLPMGWWKLNHRLISMLIPIVVYSFLSLEYKFPCT
jgi:hypothetical protein